VRSSASRIVWGLVLALGLIGLGLGLLFWASGPEMVFLTVLFGGAGAYLTIEALPRVLGWED